MRFSIWPATTRPWHEILEITRHCEATGWDGVWLADHFMPNTGDETPDDGPMLECWSLLGALAVSTERMRLGSLVCSATYRHPAVLANVAAALDHVSGGRSLSPIGRRGRSNGARTPTTSSARASSTPSSSSRPGPTPGVCDQR